MGVGGRHCANLPVWNLGLMLSRYVMTAAIETTGRLSLTMFWALRWKPRQPAWLGSISAARGTLSEMEGGICHGDAKPHG